MIIEAILIGASAFIFVFAILAGLTWGSYNFFVTGNENVRTMWSNVRTEYQRRADLFYNLAESVKSYAKFEKSTLTDVIAMRGGKFGKDMKEDVSKMKGLDSFFSRLMVVFEKYPKLKANEQYQALMKEVRITEDRVNIARTEYNDVVREYNISVKTFPANIIAGMFHFTERDYFETQEKVEIAPKMDLQL